MGIFQKTALGLAAAAMVVATPAMAMPAWSGDTQSAEQLRRLDIMLMVTSLRCRNSADNFQRDYDRFATTHRSTMNAATDRLRQAYAGGRSARAQNRAIDTISTSMANRYGLGHPWLNCGELRGVAQNLAGERDINLLIAAADELLAERPPARASTLARYGN